MIKIPISNILVKEKEDAHADPEIQPMKEDDGTFGEYRWATDAYFSYFSLLI